MRLSVCVCVQVLHENLGVSLNNAQPIIFNLGSDGLWRWSEGSPRESTKTLTIARDLPTVAAYISLGTKNPCKRKAVQDTFRKYKCFQDSTFFAVNVESGVSDQVTTPRCTEGWDIY